MLRLLPLPLILLCLCLPLAALTQSDDCVVSPATGTTVTVDGELTEPAWLEAARIEGFALLQSGETPAGDHTSALVLHDDRALYLGLRCSGGRDAAGTAAQRDGAAVWECDHLEVFLAPQPDLAAYYQLVLDRTGGILDALNNPDDVSAPGVAWNGEWTAAVAAEGQQWTAEIAVPFAALGLAAPTAGDVWRLKIGRDGGPDGPLMWPMNPSNSFHDRDADGALYFETDNLLRNGDFETGDVRDGVPEPWQAALTSSEVDNAPQGEFRTEEGGPAPGRRALVFKKLPTALYWPQAWNRGYRLAPGGVYELSLQARGTLRPINLRANAMVEGRPVKMSQSREPGGQFTPLSFSFVVPEGCTSVDIGISAPHGAFGETTVDNVKLRRLVHAEGAVERRYVRPDYSPDPDPIHGLDALCERAGHKPWDLYRQGDGLATHRVIFHDRKYGTEIWKLDNSPVREYCVTASIWPGWNADCSRLMLPADRMAGKERKGYWLLSPDFSHLTPMPTRGMPLWDLEDPNVYYVHSPGHLQAAHLQTGEVKTLATWEPRARERSYGLTRDNRSVFVVDHDGGTWVRYRDGDVPAPLVKVLDCYGQRDDDPEPIKSLMSAGADDKGALFRIIVGTRIDTHTGEMERVIVPITGHTEYLKAFISGQVEFPRDAALPKTDDLDELFEVYHLYPSCSHGHLSYSPDGEYTCWDGSPTSYRTRDEGDRHEVAISPDGWVYHTCWFHDPRFYVTCVRGYLTSYSRPVNANLLSQVFTDGTWKPVCDIKMRPNAFYHGGNFATLSRDATKIHYGSSMTGVPKNYVAVMARPQPPRRPTARREADGVHLSWEPPPKHTEVRGYLVHRSLVSGDGYELLTREPVAGASYLDVSPHPATGYYYVVSTVEQSGIESGYSQEAIVPGAGETPRPVVVYREAEAAVADLPSAATPGVSVGRDRLGASDWYYLYATPAVEKRSCELTVPVPLAGDYSLWLRTRREGREVVSWDVSVDGEMVARVPARDVDWCWYRAARVSAVRGELSVTLAPDAPGAQLDLLCLATDPGFEPVGPRPEDGRAPATVAGVHAEVVRDRVIEVNWEPSPAQDLSHYNVYCSRVPFTGPDQSLLVASPTRTKLTDYGLRAETTYHYAVTAVDRRGNESPLSAPITAATAAREAPEFTLELRFDQADLSGPLVKRSVTGTHGEQYVLLPGDAGPQEDQTAAVRWMVDIPREAGHYLWLRYLPNGAESARGAAVKQSLTVLLDGKAVGTVGGGETDLSCTEANVRPEFWTWARPVSTDLVTVALPAGEHELSLANLTTEVRYDTLLITDEPSFLPPDGRLNQR